jgi:hypothetical protein
MCSSFVEMVNVLTTFVLEKIPLQEDDDCLFTEMFHILLEVWASFIEFTENVSWASEVLYVYKF